MKTGQERMKEKTDELEAEALRLSNGDPVLAAAHTLLDHGIGL